MDTMPGLQAQCQGYRHNDRATNTDTMPVIDTYTYTHTHTHTRARATFSHIEMTYILRTRQANRHFRLSRQYIYIIIIIDLRQTGYRGDLACSLALYSDILAVLTSGTALSACLHPAQSLSRPQGCCRCCCW